MRGVCPMVVFVALIWGFAAGSVQAQVPVLDPRLALSARGAQKVILVMRSVASAEQDHPVPDAGDARALAVYARLEHRAERAQANLRAWLRTQNIPHRAFSVVNAVTLEAEPDLLSALAQRSDIKEILVDWVFRVPLPEGEGVPDLSSGRAVEASISLIAAPAVWELGFRGQGVTVASADTGVQWDHPALISRYRGWNGNNAVHDYHWHDAIHSNGGVCGANAIAPCDDNSHGTHTVGTMLGADGTNQVGVAPDAQWIACRNMDRGDGRPSTYIECMQFFLAPTNANGTEPRPDMAPHIINNSWGCPPSEQCVPVSILREAVANLRSAGVLFVAAAGNSGSTCGSVQDPPAIYEESLVIGNTTLADTMNGSSSRGPVTVDGSNRLKPDLSAPGTLIRSTIPGGQYGIKTGTSMAAPHVAGVAALLMSADPSLRRNPERVEALLKQATRPVNSSQVCGGFPAGSYPNPVSGHGRIDALLAVSLLSLFRHGFESAPVPN